MIVGVVGKIISMEIKDILDTIDSIEENSIIGEPGDIKEVDYKLFYDGMMGMVKLVKAVENNKPRKGGIVC